MPLSGPLLISAVHLSRSDQAFLLCSNDKPPTGLFSFSLPVCLLFPVADGTPDTAQSPPRAGVFSLSPAHGQKCSQRCHGCHLPIGWLQCECKWGLLSPPPCRAEGCQLSLQTFASVSLDSRILSLHTMLLPGARAAVPALPGLCSHPSGVDDTDIWDPDWAGG